MKVLNFFFFFFFATQMSNPSSEFNSSTQHATKEDAHSDAAVDDHNLKLL